VDANTQSVLDEYEQRAARESKLMQQPGGISSANIDEMLLPVGPATGTLLNLLIKEAKAKRILEFGTSFGYSSLWKSIRERRSTRAACGLRQDSPML
jgi:predicted O-methyltransferase YrrM